MPFVSRIYNHSYYKTNYNTLSLEARLKKLEIDGSELSILMGNSSKVKLKDIFYEYEGVKVTWEIE